MASPFECELRFMISDIDKFKRKLRELNAKVIFDYEFTDDYYVNYLKKPWDLTRKNLRLRIWKKPETKCEILFSKLELFDINGLKFKRSVLKEGKLCLYEGKLEDCKKLLESLGFRKWFSIEKKNCTLYLIENYNFKTIHEFIPNLGWTGELEIEGDNPEKVGEKLENQIKLLGINKTEVTSDTLSAIYAKKNGYCS